MKRKRIAKAVALALCMGMLGGCGQQETAPGQVAEKEDTASEASQAADAETNGDADPAAQVMEEPLSLTIYADREEHEISDMLFGIFFEDINFAADGGLYAEMVQNRSFEFTELAKGNELHAWEADEAVKAEVVKDDRNGALNCNNPNYLVLTNKSPEYAGIANTGFLDGMSIEEGRGYRVSFYARSKSFAGDVKAQLLVGDQTAAEVTFSGITADWGKYEAELLSSLTANKDVRLKISIADGSVCLDMISLFPQDTYKNRENGLRADLAEKLEELHPAFIRFPGGCVTEGVTLKNAYHWKDSIGVDENGDPLLFRGKYGDVAARKMGQNIWTDESSRNDRYPSFMSYGLGFYEYFQLAEDIGAVGVPVLNAGLACQGQGTGTGPGIHTEGFEQYVRDALDLIEFCRGGADTTWGAVRIAMGHEEPFELPYVCIGNENTGEEFWTKYDAFAEALNQAKQENPDLYGGTEFIYSAGFDDGDSGYAGYIAAYEHAEKYLAKHPDVALTEYAGAIDQHYYNAPEWFLSHADYYDPENYGRDEKELDADRYGGGIPVFVGEYAAQSNTWKAGLAEAAYMTGLERNGDIVRMAAYAPLFGNLTATHWAPDLIWFNNHQVTASVDYYVQKLFADHVGTTLLASALTGAALPEDTLRGRVGVGTWDTAATFDNVKVTNTETGEVLGEDAFDDVKSLENWMMISDGRWTVKDGELVQSSASTNTGRYGNTGSAAYFGEASWENYTYELDATKSGGKEGFLIPFAVLGTDHNIFWNIGGWNNTVSCLQIVEDGVKSGQVGGTVQNCSVRTGQTYHLKIEVSGDHVCCYIDDELYVDYTVSSGTKASCYQVVSTDETQDVIVKLVNVTGEALQLPVRVEGTAGLSDTADLYVAAGASPAADNILGREEVVSIAESTLPGISEEFIYEMPAYSVSVIRIHRK